MLGKFVNKNDLLTPYPYVLGVKMWLKVAFFGCLVAGKSGLNCAEGGGMEDF